MDFFEAADASELTKAKAPAVMPQIQTTEERNAVIAKL
jgi:hypothetical protein